MKVMFKYKKLLTFIIFYYFFIGVISENLIEFNSILKSISFIIDVFVVLFALSVLKKIKTNESSFKMGYLFFLIISSFTFILNYPNISLLSHLNGLREFLFFISSLVLFSFVFENSNAIVIIQWMRKIILIISILQIPISLIQFSVHGANDYVGGSFGRGGSGILTITIFYFVAFLIYSDYFLLVKKGKNKILFYFLLFIPIAFNETKISYILLPIFLFYLLFLYRKINNSFVILIISIILLISFNAIYSELKDSNNAFLEIFTENYLTDYLISTDVYRKDISRFTRLYLSYEFLNNNSITHLLFGMGYGIGRGGTLINIESNVGYFSYLIEGSRVLLQFLAMQGGIFLVAIYLYFNFYYVYEVLKKKIKFNYAIMYFISTLFVVSWFYNDALRSSQAFITVASFYIVFLSRSNLHFNLNNNSPIN